MTSRDVWRIRLEHWRDIVIDPVRDPERWPAISLLAGGLAVGILAVFARCDHA